MHRLKRVFFSLFISIITLVSCSFVLAEESLTVTTYYPAPYGVFNEMRLFPHSTAVIPCDADAEGTMFYNLTAHNIQICRGITGWGSSGLWSSSGDDIYNTNANNVGIGTNVPAAKLEVIGSVLFNGTVEGNTGGITIPTSDVLVGGGADGWFALRSKDVGARKVVFGSENACCGANPWTMAIDNLNHRVGIGTTAPDSHLHVKGTGQMAEIILQSDSNPGNYSDIHFDNTEAGGREYAIGNYGAASGALSNKFYIVDETAGGANRFIIDNNGNIGLGETSPQGLLHLKRSNEIDIWIEGNSPDIKLLSISAAWNSWRLGLDASDGDFEFTSNAKNTGNPDDILVDNILVIKQSGRVGIGVSSPAYQLQLSTNSAAKPTSTLWTVPSDIRVKKNIKPFTDGLGVIEKIHPVSYELNGKAGLPLDEPGIGVVAQDVKDVVPYSIKTWKAKLEPTDSEETELYDFDSNALTYVLINAVKEQQKLIEELKAQIIELKRN